MSKYSIHKIRCPYCNKEFSKEIADSFNVTLDSDSLDKVRSGSVFNIKCPECNETFFYNHPFLYHDMDKHFMVQYAPDTRIFKDFIEQADKMYNQFGALFGEQQTQRVVLGNVIQFVEKVEVLSFGLNDVVVEAYKELFFQKMNAKGVENIFVEFNDDMTDKRLSVYFKDENKEPEYYNFVDEIYDSMFELVKKLDIYDRHNDYIVDHSFIIKMFDEDCDKEPIHIELLKELEEKEISQLHDEAVKLAKEGKLDESIELLLPLAEAGYKDSQNDIGVVYEKKKDYENSAKWYKECDSELSIENLLKHYDNKRVKFTVEEYYEACEKLITLKNENGYLYMSYIHQNNQMGVEDKTKAFNYLLKGLINCENTAGLIFELGYLLEKGIGCEADQYKSHMCYEAVLDRKISTIVSTVAHYNYALQCYQGRGCEQDIPKAIKHYEIAVQKSNYRDAIEHLIKIYSLKEYKNEKRLEKLKKLLAQKNKFRQKKDISMI